MDTNRLSAAMQSALISQMTKELHASQIYLSYGIWADTQGYGGIANLLFRHSGEERDHMIKIMEYILQRGGRPVVEAIPAPPQDPVNITECFNKVFQHEVDNTTAIYKLVDLSFEEKDWATWNFAQWFVKEQIEEEKLALDLIDKVKIAGGDRASDESLFSLDEALGKMSDSETLAREATSEKP
ncbi:ferritin [Halpernia frigidisoli]|uniref:Ferritin n=1 Tax=Halpernia frigidisoli TaxID=1125876 RepID=A0A1I3E8Y0_9FLAO|nr:ferritin [Halpernia frigidisoli]SFH95440.1 ferritin [Halpernia frigidisoli]